MSDERRVLPSYVWFAILGGLGVDLIAIFGSFVDFRWLGFISVFEASAITTSVVTAIAALRIGRRQTGLAASTVTLAGWCLVAGFGVRAIELAVAVATSHRHPELYLGFSYLYWATRIVAMTGLVIAAWQSSRGLALGGAALVLMNVLPPAMWTAIYDQLGHDRYVLMMVRPILMAVVAAAAQIGVLLLLLGSVASRDRRAEPQLARSGLLLASRGVWFRVIASLTAMAMAWTSFSTAHVEAGIYLVLVLAVVEIAALVMFGVGLLRASDAGVGGLPQGLLAAAGVIAVWCAGVTYSKLWRIVDSLTMPDEYNRMWLDALTVLQPVAMVASVVLLLVAVAHFAQQRGDAEMTRKMRGGGVAFAILTLFAVLLTTMVGADESHRNVALFGLLGGLCGLVAQLVLAATCAAASQAIEQDVSLPRAQVV